MGKFCVKCGAQLADGAKFCPKCGASVMGATSAATQQPVGPRSSQPIQPQASQPIRPQMPNQTQYQPPVQPNYQPQYQPSRSNNGNTNLIVIGVIVFAIVVIGGLLLTNMADDGEDKNISPTATTTSTQQAASLDSFIREKDDVDVAIGSCANEINAYLANHTNFRGANTIKQNAENLTKRAQANYDKLKSTQVSDADKAKKELLLQVIDCEISRARGLYKGVVDSQNGGDYSLGFGEGTKASYKFDSLNQQLSNMR